MKSVSISINGDVNPDKFMPWINDLVQVEGPSILRSKGILAFSNEPKRFVFQGVHMMMGAEPGKPWSASEKRGTKMVFIGRKLPREIYTRGLEQCLAQ